MKKLTSLGKSSTHEVIFSVVRRIPRGRVATYGQIAALAGLPRQPRLVGYALHALPTSTAVPWHRVINSRGMVSVRSDGTASLSQRLLLEREGVHFDGRGRVSLERHQWRPARSPTATANKKGKR
ncbi:MAG TPA: MGMT family protein [Gemmatimonadaceae bacterium]|nr:MGMT family protein [Gemmatimonadaceae bacterium]